MYVKTTSRTNKDGTPVRYLHLARNQWDPAAGRSVPRVLFGLVASRALAPSSKLAAAEWISSDVHIGNLPAIGEQACYRAMDWLLQIRAPLEQEIFAQVANLLNLEVDLLFFDYPANEARDLVLAA